ncbi:MAG: LysM peptidoglycan-binding domain-containing protein [Verrucomicrobiota bacterium]
MKVTFALLALSTLLSTPSLCAASETDALKVQVAEQAARIKTLEQENERLRAAKTNSKQSHQTDDASTTTYTIRRGDNIEKIARSFKCSVKSIASINGIKPSSIIHPGQKLRLPATAAASRETSDSTAPQTPVSTPGPNRTHVIREGDTFSSLAKKYRVSTKSLIAANPEAKPTALRNGMRVRIPGKVAASSEQTAARTPASVPVEKPAKAAEKTQRLEAAVAAKPEPQETPAKPAAEPETPAATLEDAPVPAPSSSAPTGTAKIRPVTIDGEVSFGDFAVLHGTDIARLNNLNGLDLTGTTVLAKGSELYVPSNP